MRKYTEKEYTKKQVVCEELVCDICKKSAKHPFWEWGESLGSEKRVNVSYTDGIGYEDGSGHVSMISFDLCPECFESQIISFLRSLGAEPYVDELDS